MKITNTTFESIYTEYYHQIHCHVSRIVKNENAEDVVQDAFIRAHNYLSKNTKEILNIKAWIYQIATNAAIDFIRKNKNNFTTSEQNGLHQLHSEKKDTQFIHSFIKKDGNDCIRKMIDNMPEKYSTVLILKDFEGFKIEEISKILGISLANTKMRIHRAREIIKKNMKDSCCVSHQKDGTLACEKKEA